jgi:retinol dehydrogenase-12
MKAQYPLSKRTFLHSFYSGHLPLPFSVLNIFFVRAFDAHLSSPVVTINAANPGFCYSELRRQFHGVMSIAIGIFEGLFALTSEQGSRVIIRAAIWHKKDEELRGEYITTENVEEPSDYVLSEEGHIAQERIWVRGFSVLSVDSHGPFSSLRSV